MLVLEKNLLRAGAISAGAVFSVAAIAQSTGRIPNWTHSCEGRAQCQLFGCAGPDSSGRWQGIGAGGVLPTYCTSNRRGFADAETECQRIGGRPRPGPGGAPYIWCDAPREHVNSSEPVPAGTSASPDYSRATTRADRAQIILDFGSTLLDIYSQALANAETPQQMSDRYASEARQQMNENQRAARQGLGDLAADFRTIAQNVTEQSLGNLDTAHAKCGFRPRTRAEIARCFQSLANDSIGRAADCERKAANLETLGPAAKGNLPRRDDPANRVAGGQTGVFVACSDAHLNEARASNCVAVGILRQGTQFNPLMQACAKRWGII